MKRILILKIMFLWNEFSEVVCPSYPQGACPDNWFSEVGVEFCYFDTGLYLKYTSALQLCSSYHAFMVMPKTTTEVDVIRQLVPDVDDAIYTGLKRNPYNTDEWKWLDGTTLSTGSGVEVKWAPDEPLTYDANGWVENCVAVTDKLHDRQCVVELRVVCQIDAVQHVESTTKESTTTTQQTSTKTTTDKSTTPQIYHLSTTESTTQHDYVKSTTESTTQQTYFESTTESSTTHTNVESTTEERTTQHIQIESTKDESTTQHAFVETTEEGSITQQTVVDEETCICHYCLYNDSYTTPKPMNNLENIQERLNKLKTENTVDKVTLSSTIRKLVCANDERPSARYVGFMGIAILTTVGALVFIPDLFVLVKNVRYICK